MSVGLVKNEKNEILKVVAILSMSIDHIGIALIDNAELFRMMGRLALPIFAYQLARGILRTSNSFKYLLRLFLFAILSQLPYMLLFQTMTLNILFTFFISLIFITLLQNKKYIFFPVIVALVFYIPFEYGWFGILIPILYYVFKETNMLTITSIAAATILYSYTEDVWLQLFSLFGVILCLYLPQERWKIYVNKYFFYWFYPVHIVLLLFYVVFLSE